MQFIFPFYPPLSIQARDFFTTVKGAILGRCWPLIHVWILLQLGTMEKLFVYGTLQNPDTQISVFGRATPGRPDNLPDFVKGEIILDGTPYFTVRPRSGYSVSGMVLEVTSDELRRGDIYETDAYCRISVTLDSGETAWVYRDNHGQA